VCNERQLQGTLAWSKQMQERDEFLRAARSSDHTERKQRINDVINDEFRKPLPVSAQMYQELSSYHAEDEIKTQECAERHMAQIKAIQAKLQSREEQVARKKEFERKKHDLLNSKH
jgi:hypothetical protein